MRNENVDIGFCYRENHDRLYALNKFSFQLKLKYHVAHNLSF